MNYFKELTDKTPLNIDKSFKCDDCGAIFKGEDILLDEKSKNIEFPGAKFMGIKIFNFNQKDYVMHCPNCTKVALFGFDMIE
jgi:DNA-directed RNA polymerase subunit RPC12/RpoP